MSFTLATLKSTVQDYLQVNETTFNNNLNTFIKEAESRIFKLVQLPEQRKNVQGPLSASNRFWATPSDFLRRFHWQSLIATTSTTIWISSIRHSLRNTVLPPQRLAGQSITHCLMRQRLSCRLCQILVTPQNCITCTNQRL